MAEKARIENSITLLVVLQLKYAVFIVSSACEDSYLGLRKLANPWVLVLNFNVYACEKEVYFRFFMFFHNFTVLYLQII